MSSDKQPGVEFFVKGMMSKNKEERIPLLEKALELGLSGAPEIDAKFSLGQSYGFAAGGASSDEEMEVYYSKAQNLMEEALELDSRNSEHCFSKTENRNYFEVLDVIITSRSEKIYETSGIKQAITYLEQKVRILDYLPGTSPLLGCLYNLGSLYEFEGNIGGARQCFRQIIEADTVRADSQREIELRQTAEKRFSQSSNPSSTQGGNTNAQKSGGGCYIATACYGSYDAPEVVVLREFRDEKLSKNILGKLLIKGYYAYSPYIASILRNKPAFNALVRKYILDNFVKQLHQQ